MSFMRLDAVFLNFRGLVTKHLPDFARFPSWSLKQVPLTFDLKGLGGSKPDR